MSELKNRTNYTKKIAASAILIGVGFILSILNPFAYFTLFGTKINPFAHLINAISGVLLGLPFAFITAIGIALLRFSLGFGTIHAFHGGFGGTIPVGLLAALLWRKYKNSVELAALTESLGTVFIGGTIAQLIAPIGSLFALEGFLTYWFLFVLSSIPGSVIGFLVLQVLKKADISRADFYTNNLERG